MKLKTVVPLLAIVCACISCDTKTTVAPPSAFSEITSYFDSEISALNQSDLTLNKTLTHQNKTEQILIKNPDWSAELVPFTEAISNQVAKAQSYKRDSILQNGSKILLLSARDSSAIVKRLTVYAANGKTDSLIIIKRVENSYYSSADTLTYYGQGNYLIKAQNLPGIGKKIGFVLSGSTGPGS